MAYKEAITGPLSSIAPLPYNLLSSITGSKGAHFVQPSPAGTTSKWPIIPNNSSPSPNSIYPQ